MIENIVITVSDLRETLEDLLERKATDEELERFREYVMRDIYQYLRDNAKTFVRDEI